MKAPIVLGACAGARTTTAALGAIEDEAKSKVPALGYTVTYAVGNTLLTVWGVARRAADDDGRRGSRDLLPVLASLREKAQSPRASRIESY